MGLYEQLTAAQSPHEFKPSRLERMREDPTEWVRVCEICGDEEDRGPIHGVVR